MKTIYYILIVIPFFFVGCEKKFLEVLPEDKITQAIFWESESDALMALNGIYSVLRETSIYGAGPSFEACTPDGYQWSHWNGQLQQIGNGSISSTSGGVAADRWTMCYRIVNRANYFLENVAKVPINEATKKRYSGEAYFLRGIAYSLLAETYGGAPILIKTIDNITEARSLVRASLAETWEQAITDLDLAYTNLDIQAVQKGRADKGAALGLKMRALLYKGDFAEVITVANEIEGLNKYHLYPSYEGLFKVENENNTEVLFDIQYMDGEQGQGNNFAWLGQPGYGLLTDVGGASCVAPTQQMIDKYETIDGSPINPSAPYDNRDPRLDFTVLRSGAYFNGLLYPVDVKNHTGQRVNFGMRKYLAEGVKVNTAMQNPINFIVLRYADVLLSKAEAILETGGKISDAIDLINQIRTGRTDVKISLLPITLSKTEALAKLRHERRIEFFLEGTYWSDIRRWNIGSLIYPSEVRAADGSLIETKFPNGYHEKYNLLPIPDNERALNNLLDQNPDW